MKNHKEKNNQGLSFLELLIALMIFSIAILGIFEIFPVALNAQLKASQEIIATNLARALMAEIMAKDFVDPDEGGTTIGLNANEFINVRTTLDDIDDYHLWNETPPKNLNNLGMDGTDGRPDYSDFTRSVSVVFCVVSGTITCPGAGTDYKQVTVTVTGPFVRDIVLSQIKAK